MLGQRTVVEPVSRNITSTVRNMPVVRTATVAVTTPHDELGATAKVAVVPRGWLHEPL
jgi:hypothetical protein